MVVHQQSDEHGEQDQDDENAINKSKIQVRNDTIQDDVIIVVDCNLISEYETKKLIKFNISLGLFLTQICI